MNIGDRVRSISSSEEGVVIRFLSGVEVEVEIEDGFRIPYMRTDLVVVSATEQKIFGEKAETNKSTGKEDKPANPVHALKGIFLGFTHYNDKILEMHLANNTDMVLSFVFCEEEGGNYIGVRTGMLQSRESKKIHEVNIDKFERWSAFIFQILYFKQGRFSLPSPLITRLKFKANSFFKNKKEIPLVNKEGYCFQMDETHKVINPEQLKEMMLGGGSNLSENLVKEKVNTLKIGGRREIDLHIESIDPKGSQLSNAQIITKQIRLFEQELDRAIVDGVDEVIFIHGVGAGVLKASLQNKLSGHQHVAYFKDAQKSRFGYGATLVKIK
ncbi:MAG: Smr/MutS family protein [Bacteroidota bacterium]